MAVRLRSKPQTQENVVEVQEEGQTAKRFADTCLEDMTRRSRYSMSLPLKPQSCSITYSATSDLQFYAIPPALAIFLS